MSLGEVLRAAREEHGLTIEEVSARTRIRGTLIRGIEADDFAPCGGAVYARGHIRSIAGVVGIDPAPLIAEYDRSHVSDVPPVASVATPTHTNDADLIARSNRRSPRWGTAMAVALVAIIVLAAAELLVGNSPGKPGPKNRATASGPTTSPRHPQASSSPPPVFSAQVPPNKVTLLIRVRSSRTWLSVANAAGTLFQGLLDAGQRKEFVDGHVLSVVIGNAPAVDLVVNHHDIGSPPTNGSVVYRHSFHRSDYASAQG